MSISKRTASVPVSTGSEGTEEQLIISTCEPHKALCFILAPRVLRVIAREEGPGGPHLNERKGRSRPRCLTVLAETVNRQLIARQSSAHLEVTLLPYLQAYAKS